MTHTQPAAVPSFDEIASQYLDELALRAKPKTIRDTRAALARFVKATGARDLDDVTRAAVAAWRVARARSGTSHKTINTEVGAIRAALNYGVSIGTLAASPLERLKSLPIRAEHRRRVARALGDIEIGRLLDAAAEFDRTHRGFPRAPLLRTLVLTGLRWNEAIHLQWSDFVEAERLLVLRAETTKNQHADILPVDPELAAVLAGLRLAFGRATGRAPTIGDRIFLTPRGRPWTSDPSNFRRYLRDMLERACIAEHDELGRVVHIHALRHTFCTRLARAGVPFQTAMLLSRHRTAQLLASVYTHLRIDEARSGIALLKRLPVSGSFTGGDSSSSS